VGLSWQLSELSDLGIMFMMFLMGLSVDFEKLMKENVYRASFMSICGGLLTFLCATTVTYLLGFELNTAILVGISFISTSTAVGFMVLNDLGDNYSKVFNTIMAVGTTDDICAMLAYSMFLIYIGVTTASDISGSGIQSVVTLFLVVLGFIILVLWFGRPLSEKLINWTVNSSNEQSVVSLSLIILFTVAFLSQNIGLSEVTGAFLAGTILARSGFSIKIIKPKIESLSEGFFVPLFFVYTGVRINIIQMVNSTPLNVFFVNVPIDIFLFLGLLMVVMASKYIATYAAAWMIGDYRRDEMNKMGLVMTPMGEYTLVIGLIGVTQLGGQLYGISSAYSVLALIVLVTSILTPIMLRIAYESR
jgi:Kef-type K+ transport system membrane component KefB